MPNPIETRSTGGDPPIGQKVEFEIDRCVMDVGWVVALDEATGRVTIRDADGSVWKGYEYQLRSICD